MSTHSLSPPPAVVNPPMCEPTPISVDSIAAARDQQAEDQVVALANIVTAILAARRGDTPQRVAELPTDEARRILAHARRALAERDPIKVGVAHYRAHRALCAAVEDLFLGGVRQLTPAQRNAYRVALHRALTAYQASLEGHLGEPQADELAAVTGGREASVS